jgi:hypothetical protein
MIFQGPGSARDRPVTLRERIGEVFRLDRSESASLYSVPTRPTPKSDVV